MPQIGQDVGYAGGGLSLAAWLGTVNLLLQGAVLIATLVLIAYRIRNAKTRSKSDEGGL